MLQSKEALDKLATLTHCGYGAPCVLLFSYDENIDWKNPLEDGIRSGIEDVSISATYIMLRAIECGIHTTWCNYFPNTRLEKAFALPENERAVLIMPIGYAAEDVQPSPDHTATKSYDDIVRAI